MGVGRSKPQKEESSDYAVERSQLIARVIPPTELVKLICSYLRYESKWNVDDEKGFHPWLDSIQRAPRVPSDQTRWRGTTMEKEMQSFFIYTDGATAKTQPTILLDGVTISSAIIRGGYWFPSCGYLHLSARHYGKLDEVCKYFNQLPPVAHGKDGEYSGLVMQFDDIRGPSPVARKDGILPGLVMQFDDIRCPSPVLSSSRLIVDLTLAFCQPIRTDYLLFYPVAWTKSS